MTPHMALFLIAKSMTNVKQDIKAVKEKHFLLIIFNMMAIVLMGQMKEVI